MLKYLLVNSVTKVLTLLVCWLITTVKRWRKHHSYVLCVWQCVTVERSIVVCVCARVLAQDSSVCVQVLAQCSRVCAQVLAQCSCVSVPVLAQCSHLSVPVLAQCSRVSLIVLAQCSRVSVPVLEKCCYVWEIYSVIHFVDTSDLVCICVFKMFNFR